jgi:hypothetical protein
MSLRPNGFTEIPAETSRVAKAAFPKGCLVMRARDALGPLFTDEQFAELFATRGRPSVVTGTAGIGAGAGSSSRVSPIGRPPMRCEHDWTGSTRWAWTWTTLALTPQN